jgi:hypothetical protein
MPERRIAETDLVAPALRLAAERPNGEISTADLILELTDIFRPSGQDAELIHNRQDTHFSQKVRNLISHRNSPSSFIANGLAEYTGDGIRITEAGRRLLTDLGH